MSERHHRDLRGRLRRGRAEQRVERLEHDVRGGDEGDAADRELRGRGPAHRHDRDRVARLGLQRRRELLVEYDRAGRQRPLQQSHRVRPRRCSAAVRRGSILRPSGCAAAAAAWRAPASERRGRDRCGSEHAGLCGDARGRVPRRAPSRPRAPASRGARCGRPCAVIVVSECRRRATSRRAATTAAASTRIRMAVRAGDRRSPRQGDCERCHTQHVATDDTPVEQLDLAVCTARRRLVVRGDDDAETEFLAQRLDQIEHALTGVGIEMPGRLVAQQSSWLLRERSCDGYPLRLTTGQLAGQAVRACARDRRAATARAARRSPRDRTAAPRIRRSRRL